MTPPRPTELAHRFVREALREGDLAIDATAGNGHDTLMLAERVGESGRVLAFDIQSSAIKSARMHIKDAGFQNRVEFHLTSHAKMAELATPSSASVIMFNLGYLPGGDHGVTTEVAETLRGLESAMFCLKAGGLLTVVCYPGHTEGAIEATAVEEWLQARRNDGWRVAKYAMLGTREPAPFLLVASKPNHPPVARSETR
jgi:tRNA1(Val) A37 N6-methylase TrmN6